MIQRIQSIFLAIIAIAMGVMAFTPIWDKTGQSESVTLDAMSLTHLKNGQVLSSENTMYILAAALVVAAVALVSLFSFKNRKRQMLLGLINSLAIGATLLILIYTIFKKGMLLYEPSYEGHYGIGFYAAGVAFFANWIANRFIRKDEMLVRSADRMR